MSGVPLLNNRGRQAFDATTPIYHLGLHQYPFTVRHFSIWDFIQLVVIGKMNSNLRHEMANFQVKSHYKRNNHRTVFVSLAKTNNVVMYNLNWYTGEHKCMVSNLYPLKMVIIIIMLTQVSLWVYSWWFASLLCLFISYITISVMEVRKTHLELVFICHYIGLKQPAWYLGNMSDVFSQS